ncbi:hypothetical protein [Haloquadratum walsbyi]|uniref:hypothetical protein n=1 Tax=Haloquadratum walsbyi TaxID=293091 RepID=UPI0023F39C60|nr:hypothetical protein [Haloquadratum walsbyi]
MTADQYDTETMTEQSVDPTTISAISGFVGTITGLKRGGPGGAIIGGLVGGTIGYVVGAGTAAQPIRMHIRIGMLTLDLTLRHHPTQAPVRLISRLIIITLMRHHRRGQQTTMIKLKTIRAKLKKAIQQKMLSEF